LPAITLYTMGHCAYCARAKTLLRRKGSASWTEFDLEKIPEKRAEMQARTGGRRTVPEIFIGDVHVGGSDDLHKLDAAGTLDRLLAMGRPG
jgi:glutaredoxin 3